VSGQNRIRRQQLIRQAEGYLELGMAQHALGVLDGWEDGDGHSGHILFLRGEALKELGRFQDALDPLRRASEIAPSRIPTWLSLGWCYKRVGRLDLAIESLEEAISIEPKEALIHYNLACYWSLAGNKRRALQFLAQAIELDEAYRDRVGGESDFDPIRNDPAFRALTSVIV
jgi:tetratricopeptide (TPR) repeat protein